MSNPPVNVVFFGIVDSRPCGWCWGQAVLRAFRSQGRGCRRRRASSQRLDTGGNLRIANVSTDGQRLYNVSHSFPAPASARCGIVGD
jgi:hypothetical protein